MLSASQAGLLAELGIVQWRTRAGRAFPGSGVLTSADVAPDEICRVDKRSASTEPLGGCATLIHPTTEAELDLCLYANTASKAEADLLARILHAVQGLRGDLRLQHRALNAPQPLAYAHLCLDDADLPSPATMLADVSSKRRVWQVLQDTVARLP